VRQALFDQAKLLHASGKTYIDIATQIGINRRTVAKWIKTDVLPHRRRLALKPSSPLYFKDFLTRRWAEGDRVSRRLFLDIRRRGYTGSLSNLERLLSTWRTGAQGKTQPQQQWSNLFEESPAIDPVTGWQVSPVTAASLCMKPTRMLTPSDAAKVAVLKEVSPNFVVMRQLAMRFRGLLRGGDPSKLDRWLHDARHSNAVEGGASSINRVSQRAQVRRSRLERHA
jgi:transposase-like protein